MAILHIAALCREGIENRELALELVCGLIFDVAGSAGRALRFRWILTTSLAEHRLKTGKIKIPNCQCIADHRRPVLRPD